MVRYDPNKKYDEYDEAEFLEAVVKEARELRRLISRDDHWCIEDCQKCKTRESFDLALAELDKFQGK